MAGASPLSSLLPVLAAPRPLPVPRVYSQHRRQRDTLKNVKIIFSSHSSVQDVSVAPHFSQSKITGSSYDSPRLPMTRPCCVSMSLLLLSPHSLCSSHNGLHLFLYRDSLVRVVPFAFFCVCVLFRAAPAAYGGSQARG